MPTLSNFTREFTITRVFDAPRELVFRAWTERDLIAAWWGPAGIRTPVSTIRVDARQGGSLRLTMVSDADGAEYPVAAVFSEFVAPERLVLAWLDPVTDELAPAYVATVTFADLGGSTEVTFHQTGVAGGDAGFHQGWISCFDELENHLVKGISK